MTDLREILIATDFSPLANHALQVALALARQFQARLHVLHVVEDAADEMAAYAQLNALEAECDPLRTERAVAVGHPAPEILTYAAREKTDLIVLGTHGRSPSPGVLLGSVAESVLNAAPCEVLTIGPKAQVSKAPATFQTPALLSQERCMVCATPAQRITCDTCNEQIQGEALERSRQDEQAAQQILTL